ncbi:hypothetical protein Tsubulata_039402 [Turnera subulata]|uniref:Pentacotripeptide-repeat region of PRORP domain-containing protein n=1 Tax=Turnera subulata TaxID=218843 RepID=A0A9Q0G8W1_9ROSI|nr:hypothetical protein Tsubulata_039402 [Turnera subulata]
MARAQSSILTFFRQIPRTRQNPDTQIRKLTLESKETNLSTDQVKTSSIEKIPNSVNHHFSDVAKEVSKRTRTKPRWELTLVSDFPSFNFDDPVFFREFLKHQNNVFLALKFYHWLSSRYNFVPDQVSCNSIFDSLLDAKACNAAKQFLELTGFVPEVGSLERYIRCLCEGGLVLEALEVFEKVKEGGVCPFIETWKAALLCCLKIKRTDLVWQLYQEMIEKGVVANLDVETVEYIIRAFASEGNEFKGYELLRQVLEDGFVMRNIAFNKLIFGFCKKRQFSMVSELLHTMIEKHNVPDIYTYQEVINGLCKRKKSPEAFSVFNDLKDRGYFPDAVVYTTMIHGLCDMKWIGEARKLWFEMINRGIPPNIYTYNALIDGFCKIGNFEVAWKLHKEMCDKGHQETTVTCNTMISGLCLHNRASEAFLLFKGMAQKGIVPDAISYNALIQGFCKEGRIAESRNLFEELVSQGLRPQSRTYTLLVEKLCEMGDIQEAGKLLKRMLEKGLKPMAHHLIQGICKKGSIAQDRDLLKELLDQGLQLKASSYSLLIQKISELGDMQEAEKWLKHMKSRGLEEQMAQCVDHLVYALCKQGHATKGLEWFIILTKYKLKPQRKKTFERLVWFLSRDNSLENSLPVLDFLSRVGFIFKTGFRYFLIGELCKSNALFVGNLTRPD